MKLLAATALSLSLFVSASAQSNQVGAASASVQDSLHITITRSGSQPSQQGASERFTGSVRIDPLFQVKEPSRMYGASVTFEPGARTAWHSHPLGQILIVTEGIGRVQRWGDPLKEIRPGDVVRIPPGQKHWHGAAPNSSMTHIAIAEQIDNASTGWMEKVSDTQYDMPVEAQQPASAAPARAVSGISAQQPSRAQQLMGDIAPKLAELTDEVLFGDVWERPELSKRDRSLATVAALIAMNRPDQLRSHPSGRAKTA